MNFEAGPNPPPPPIYNARMGAPTPAKTVTERVWTWSCRCGFPLKIFRLASGYTGFSAARAEPRKAILAGQIVHACPGCGRDLPSPPWGEMQDEMAAGSSRI
jgi:hypothetical protein